MGKWESWDMKLLWMYVCVCECICLCVYLRWLRVGRVGQSGTGWGGGVLQCVKETEIGGSVWRGHIHLFCIYLRRRPPEHGWQMSGECGDDTRAVMLLITISAQLCWALSSSLMAPHRTENQKTEHSGVSTELHHGTRQTQGGLSLFLHLNFFWLICFQISCMAHREVRFFISWKYMKILF